MQKTKKNKAGRWIFILSVIAVCVIAADAIGTHSATATTDIRPGDYGYAELDEAQLHKGNLILVRDGAACAFAEMDDLTSIYEYKNDTYSIKNTSLKLNRQAIQPLNTMMTDFRNKTGLHDINIISAYRPAEEQKQLYEEKVAQTDEKEAARWVAKPGCSEHHTGYALDLGIYTDDGRSLEFRGTGKYRWICDNAARYGFVVRYEKNKESLTGIGNEPWHLRYVGRPHAWYMAQKNLCLEEYLELLKKYRYGEKHLLVKDSSAREYEVYYVPAADTKAGLPVPKDREYEVSGNNTDGFIVTSFLG